jgi:hypothetical protein
VDDSAQDFLNEALVGFASTQPWEVERRAFTEESLVSGEVLQSRAGQRVAGHGFKD